MRLRQVLFVLTGVVSMVTVGSAASASSITTFGSLSAATFGGSGIPNDAVQITTIRDGNAIITLGLTATPRFTVGELPNNGAGTFDAPAGTSSSRALWNFDFYASVSGTPSTTYDFRLLYDFDPGVGTPTANLGNWDLGTGPLPIQNSENLTFSFLATSAPGITPPTFGPFNPFASGEYTFDLEAFNAAGALVGSDTMQVDVTPEPSSLLLLGTGLAALAGGIRRLRK